MKELIVTFGHYGIGDEKDKITRHTKTVITVSDSAAPLFDTWSKTGLIQITSVEPVDEMISPRIV